MRSISASGNVASARGNSAASAPRAMLAGIRAAVSRRAMSDEAIDVVLQNFLPTRAGLWIDAATVDTRMDRSQIAA